ncbi:MAG TPA: type II toxin-antitoxin system HicA family toxin [Candidatus Fimimorpha faecalis]|uniref:Type II toxin-antitoxin system HicA family toxin n=1 Tax=Candidatus Fimimorpha faecalis TaxID=2840824 RepID=A0A9D1EEP1_9FIRM|nr:type II toxin-antitoxin system HicA family toxin [Candidatus Fimimorpha faecalis]
MHMKFREVEKIITANDWKRVRINGSHYQYKKLNSSKTVVIPNHNGKDLSIGVIKNLEKITGLSLRK